MKSKNSTKELRSWKINYSMNMNVKPEPPSDWIIDIEGDGFLDTITTIWCIVCRNVQTDEVRSFLRPDLDPEGFLSFSKDVKTWIGHNIIKYDWPVLTKFGLSANISLKNTYDTLVFSRLIYQGRPKGHSLEAWGEFFKEPKGSVKDFSVYTPEMLEYCLKDTKINKLLWLYLVPYLKDFSKALSVEQFLEYECYHEINQNGFKIDVKELFNLHSSLSKTVNDLTLSLQELFPPKSKLVREITPKLTKFGTLNAQDFRWLKSGEFDLSPFAAGATFSRFEYVSFNPGSTQQVVDVLNKAGWSPVTKTDGHKDEEKVRPRNAEERLIHDKRMLHFREFGWTIDEDNLATVPATAPEGVRVLVRWRMLASRVSKIDEWLRALDWSKGFQDGLPDTIHPTITGLGTWTHRCSHTDPNVGNIPSVAPKYDPKGPIYPEASEIGRKLRSLWVARKGRVLVGTDADSIQLRVLAHYMNDPAFTQSLVTGDKSNGTDAHSLNKQALGPVCNTRDVAKTFIYAWLLGAGIFKVAQILSCSTTEAREAIERFISAYPGLKRLKAEVIPKDARQGYFTGFDGRKVIPLGSDVDQKAYKMLSGYLQNGEAVIMKHATRIWISQARDEGIPFWWVNFVHDEWQTETEDDGGLVRKTDGRGQLYWVADPASFAGRLGKLQSDSIASVGREFALNCPLAGQSKFGYNWMETH
jgi:DNA polymerase-1